MRYRNSYVDLILQNIEYILFLYVVFIIIQIICLYYEYNEKNYFYFLEIKSYYSVLYWLIIFLKIMQWCYLSIL